MSWTKLDELYESLHEETLRDVARRILSTTDVLGKEGMTETARWQIQLLQETGLLYDTIVERVAKYSNLNKRTIADIFKESQIEILDGVKQKVDTVDKFKAKRITEAIDKGINKTISEVNNLTMTTALDTSNVFKDELNRAFMKVFNGTESSEESIKKAVNNLSQKSAKITYPSGYKSGLVTAVRRAVLTSVNQVSASISLENAMELGTNLMELSAHAGARPSHQLWQGQIVSLDPNYIGDKYLTLNDIGYGTAGGFKGCNCRHGWHPYFEGTERAYSEEDLEKLNNRTVILDDKEIPLYEAKQLQRKLERGVRYYKNRFIMADEFYKNEESQENLLNFIKAKTDLDVANNKLLKFRRKTGLLSDNRTGVRVNTQGRITRVKRDNKQFESYIKILKDNPNMPDTLEKFRKIKYNKHNEFENLKLRKKIRTSYNLTIHSDKQDKHIEGTDNYNQELKNNKIKSKLIISKEEAQDFVDNYAGKGDLRRTKKGKWTNKEFITQDIIIGEVLNEDGEWEKTNYFSIEYSKEDGTHIVPRIRRKKW